MGSLFQLPPGIVKMKDGNFVMGDALTEYVKLAKIIFTQEVKVILEEEEKKTEKVQGFTVVWGKRNYCRRSHPIWGSPHWRDSS